MEKRRQLKTQNEQQSAKDDVGKKPAADLEGEDLSQYEESSFNNPTTGKNKFEMMLKSMIARLEFCNYLAPKEDYGRHQSRMANKKKKAKKVNKDNAVVEKSESELEMKYDDNYYDLDDEFIDDNDVLECEDDFATEMMYEGNSNMYSSMMNSVPPAQEEIKEEIDENAE